MRQRSTWCAAMVMVLVGPTARAADYRFAPMTGAAWRAASTESVSTGSSYTVFTGLADSASLLYLTDASPPARDDVVNFDSAGEQINDYLNLPFQAPQLAGQRRFVFESTTVNSDGSKTDTIRIRCVDTSGAPADLWPGGLNFNGIPLPNGALGIGLDMPPELGGSHPVQLQPHTTITGLSIQVMSDGVLGPTTDLPVTDLILPSPSNWNGQLGLIAFDAANSAAIDSEIFLRITSTVPEPTWATVGVGALVLRRRGRGRR